MLCTSAKDMRRGFDTGRRDHWMSLWRRDAARAGQAPVELHMNAVGRSRFFSHGYSSPTLGPARARRNTPGRMRSLAMLQYKSNILKPNVTFARSYWPHDGAQQLQSRCSLNLFEAITNAI